jgi:hypothetical protein
VGSALSADWMRPFALNERYRSTSRGVNPFESHALNVSSFGDTPLDLRERKGVVKAERDKADHSTMDLGAVVTVLASSSATLAIARGIADWIRRTPQTRLVIERNPHSGSIKSTVDKIDSEAALKIIETVLKA